MMSRWARRLLKLHVKTKHCPECVEWAGLGWCPAYGIPHIGESRCGANCGCVIEYRESEGRPESDGRLHHEFSESQSPPMQINLSESQSWTRQAKIDREKGFIYDVKVVGLASGNGNDYSLPALEKALHIYEGMKVNIDHKKRSEKGEDRKVLDRFGRLRQPRVGADGLYANLQYNPKHPLTESILWWAENDPEALGLSQYGVGEGRKKADGRYQVESITRVNSVDLVADPATTKSLFESQDPNMADNAEAPVPTVADHEAQMQEAFGNAVMAAVKDSSLDMQGKMKRIKEILQAQEKLLGKKDSEDSSDSPSDSEGTPVAESQEPQEQPQEPDTELAILRKERAVRVLCESMNVVPDSLLIDALVGLPSEEKQKALLQREAARQQMRPGSKPKSAPVPLRESQNPLQGKQGKDLATSLRRMK